MKRIILALLLIWMLPAAGQTPAAVDWRTLVDASELDRIENWERHFADAVRRAEKLEDRSFHDIDRESLAGLARTFEFRWPSIQVRRRAMCRLVETNAVHVGIGERHPCEVRIGKSGGRLTKVTGVIRFEIDTFFDPTLGAIAIGEWWTNAETGPRRVRGPERRYVGLLRVRDETTLHLLLSSRTQEYDIVIVDLGHRLPR